MLEKIRVQRESASDIYIVKEGLVKRQWNSVLIAGSFSIDISLGEQFLYETIWEIQGSYPRNWLYFNNLQLSPGQDAE
jgi:hypothetical protein